MPNREKPKKAEPMPGKKTENEPVGSLKWSAFRNDDAIHKEASPSFQIEIKGNKFNTDGYCVPASKIVPLKYSPHIPVVPLASHEALKEENIALEKMAVYFLGGDREAFERLLERLKPDKYREYLAKIIKSGNEQKTIPLAVVAKAIEEEVSAIAKQHSKFEIIEILATLKGRLEHRLLKSKGVGKE